MARGPQLQRLGQAVDPVDPGEVAAAQLQWERGARLLLRLGQQIQEKAAALAENDFYQGQTAQATVDALTRSASHLDDKRADMEKGSNALGRASDALQTAQTTYRRLAKEADSATEPKKEHVVGPKSDPAVVAADTKYTNDMAAFRAAEQAREAEAEAALRTLETTQQHESDVMRSIHGEPDPWEQPRKGGNGPAGGGRGPISAGPRGPVPVPQNPTGNPTVVGTPPHETQTNPPTTTTNPPTTTTPPTTNPPTVPTHPPTTGVPQGPTAPPVGAPPLGPGGAGTPVAPAAGGGGLGSVGGGVAAGAGIGLAGLGGLAGGATGIGGGAMPIGGAGAAGAARPIGAGGARGASGVLGRSTAVPMTQGAAGGARGAAGSKSAGTGRTGSRAGAAGGRATAAGGAGGRGAAGGAGASGRGRKSRDDERGHAGDFYDDGSDWIDDEGIGPDVLR